MKKYWLWKAFKISVFVTLAIGAFGYITMSLWNWLMPAIFGLTTITFPQALGLVILSKILFGGFHRHGGGRRGWRRGMEERLAQMTPEERERFRTGMRGRRCGFGRQEPVAPEQTAV
jgi:hypothetical protein